MLLVIYTCVLYISRDWHSESREKSRQAPARSATNTIDGHKLGELEDKLKHAP